MPPPGSNEFASRVSQAQILLQAMGHAALVVSSESNFVYFTGLRFDALWSSATRSLVAVIPAEGPMRLSLPGFVADEARLAWPDAEVSTYDVPPESIVPRVVRSIKQLPKGPVDFEIGREARVGFTPNELEQIRTAIGGERVADGQELVWELRTIKSLQEIDRLRAASLASAGAFQELFRTDVGNRTELEVARTLSAAALAAGADSVGWIAMTSGRGSYGRFVGAPRDRRIRKGDMVWTDLGVRVDGYWSDYCRAAVVGGPSDQQQELQEAVVDATAAGIRVARAGTPVTDVAAAVRNRSMELGLSSLGFGRLGHGIGLSATEPPNIAEWDQTILRSGMVVTIEPAVVDDSGLYCCEQVLSITGGDPEVLSVAPTHLATVQ